MAKKKKMFRKDAPSLTLPSEKRWTVIDKSGRCIYLPSESGLDEKGAEALSERLLAETRVVPEGSLNSFGTFDPDLLEGALEAAHAEEEE